MKSWMTLFSPVGASFTASRYPLSQVASTRDFKIILRMRLAGSEFSAPAHGRLISKTVLQCYRLPDKIKWMKSVWARALVTCRRAGSNWKSIHMREPMNLTTPGIASHKVKSGDIALTKHCLHLSIGFCNGFCKLAIIWSSKCLHILLLQNVLIHLDSGSFFLPSLLSQPCLEEAKGSFVDSRCKAYVECISKA